MCIRDREDTLSEIVARTSVGLEVVNLGPNNLGEVKSHRERVLRFWKDVVTRESKYYLVAWVGNGRAEGSSGETLLYYMLAGAVSNNNTTLKVILCDSYHGKRNCYQTNIT